MLKPKVIFFKKQIGNMNKLLTAASLMIVIISLADCAAPHKKEENAQKTAVTESEKLLQSGALKNESVEPVKKMRIEEYAKYRNLNSAQRDNREVLVDNFIRGLGIDGF